MKNKIEKIILIYWELRNNDEFKKLVSKGLINKKEFFNEYPEFKKLFSIVHKEEGFLPQFIGVPNDDPNYFYFFDPYMYYEKDMIVPVIFKNGIFFVGITSEATMIIEKSFFEKINEKKMTDEEACKMCIGFFLGRAKGEDNKTFLYNLDREENCSYRIKYERIFLNEMGEGDSIISDDRIKTGVASINPEHIIEILYYVSGFEKIEKKNLTSIMAWTPIFK